MPKRKVVISGQGTEGDGSLAVHEQSDSSHEPSRAANGEGNGAEADTSAKPKKVRTAYHMVAALNPQGDPCDVLAVKRSRRAAEKWYAENYLLIARLTTQVVLIRCSNREIRPIA